MHEEEDFRDICSLSTGDIEGNDMKFIAKAAADISIVVVHVTRSQVDSEGKTRMNHHSGYVTCSRQMALGFRRHVARDAPVQPHRREECLLPGATVDLFRHEATFPSRQCQM